MMCKGRMAFGVVVLMGGLQMQAQTNVVRIDATTPAPAPVPLAMRLGSAKSPQGMVIGANSQYLTMGGKPWIPVMGEFHFSRYPEAQWEHEILKMKAAGVDVIATYIIWIYHEQTQGEFNWTGQRDLRRFVQLCGKHGMYVYPRIGPWAHAEVRNGGLPDWVLKAGPVRQNDPTYLAEVGTFYAEMAKQLRGELWKDGGPVIGLQIENEYRGSGKGQGPEHIRTLKAMAVADGLDVPLYTVTGWDGAAIPLDSVLPVFGGYPDAPWDGSNKKLPANEVYAFRFGNRAAGSMGAIGGAGQNASSSYAGTPFLTAEVGDGIEDTYFRRPDVSADDVAAIPPVMLGSGANLLGYYMFHGGRNPEGGAITLQESQATGYPTDVPVKSYDFQAPLGEFGQEEPSLRKLKLVHYFLRDFGAQLAPMVPRAPSVVPANPSDARVVRVAARTHGDAGFVFLSNYVRGLEMPARPGFQVQLTLPSGVVRVPEEAIDLPAGSYGIWPVNMPLGRDMTRYATAQLFKRVSVGSETFYFFFALPGVTAELLLDEDASVTGTGGTVTQKRVSGGLRLRMKEGSQVRLKSGAHIVVLSKADAEDVWSVDDPGELVKSAAYVTSDGRDWTLDSVGQPRITYGLFGASSAKADGAAVDVGKSSIFHETTLPLPQVTLQPTVTLVRAAQIRAPWVFGPELSWRKTPVPLAPTDEDFASAAIWKISVPALPADDHIPDAFLHIRYSGDLARIYQGERLIDDQFWNGVPWVVGLREIDAGRSASEFQLRVLPLPANFPMYLERASEAQHTDGQPAALDSVEIVPEYRLHVHEMVPAASR